MNNYCNYLKISNNVSYLIIVAKFQINSMYFYFTQSNTILPHQPIPNVTKFYEFLGYIVLFRLLPGR